MPDQGAEARGRVFGGLMEDFGILKSSAEYVETVRSLVEESAQLNEFDQRCVRAIFEQSRADWQVPPALSGEIAKTTIVAQSAWTKAKKDDDFALFEPYLETLIELKRVEAEKIGYTSHPYDALLDAFEPGLNVQELDRIFAGLLPTLRRLRDTSRLTSSQPTRLTMPTALQQQYVRSLAADLGFNFAGGRIDSGRAPATEWIHDGDIRVIARFDEDTLSTGLFLTLHEIGHALQYQNIDQKLKDTPLYDAASTAMQEACARLIENNIAKSYGFLSGQHARLMPLLSTGRQLSIDELFQAVNAVSDSPSRFDADEISYPVHIFVRYTIEKGLLEGSIRTSQVPEIWNELMNDLLGIEVPNNREGCLQDVHWACGLFGYFPTYVVGTIYASAIYSRLSSEVPELEQYLMGRDFTPVLRWLTSEVYRHGGYYRSAELMRNIAGSGNLADLVPHFVTYLEHKYRE